MSDDQKKLPGFKVALRTQNPRMLRIMSFGYGEPRDRLVPTDSLPPATPDEVQRALRAQREYLAESEKKQLDIILGPRDWDHPLRKYAVLRWLQFRGLRILRRLGLRYRGEHHARS